MTRIALMSTGAEPKAYIGDSTTPDAVRTRTLQEETNRVFRSPVNESRAPLVEGQPADGPPLPLPHGPGELSPAPHHAHLQNHAAQTLMAPPRGGAITERLRSLS